MTIESPRLEDAGAIVRIAQDTGVFTPEELRVVQEMIDAYFDPAPRDDHTFVIYRNGNPNSIAGFACFGPTPLTDRVWDLYWICVDRLQQYTGIGSKLLREIEDDLQRRGARTIYLETADSPAYQPARDFYERHGYERAAHLADFYAPGEGKVIYRKALDK